MKYLEEKKVVCSIYHIDENKFNQEDLEDFKERDRYVSEYHVISKKTIPQLKKMTNKKITYIPFWVNQNKWFEINALFLTWRFCEASGETRMGHRSGAIDRRHERHGEFSPRWQANDQLCHSGA